MKVVPEHGSDALPLSVSLSGSAAFPTILTPGGELPRGDSTLLCPSTHPPAHLMPPSRLGEGEEPTQAR